MISQLEFCLCRDKEGTPLDGLWSDWPKCRVSTNNKKDEDNFPKIYN